MTGKKAMRRRRYLLLKAEFRCAICGQVDLGAEVDHVTPLSAGGQDITANCQVLCRPCHQDKTAAESAAARAANA